MSKVDAIFRLYQRGYYTAEQALAIGKNKLTDEEYTQLEIKINEAEEK